ncbi:F-box only protein 42 [Mortierella sp. GBA30]|nr:F-box only protein 42 [Mortierella sp. GBA30]
MCRLTGLNKMVIFGGSGTSAASTSVNDVHTFDLTQETWVLTVPVIAGSGGSVPAARRGHSAVCLNNTMVVFGGGVESPVDDDIWVLDASASQWVWNRITTNKQVGPGPRTGHSALLNATNMLVWGGYGSPQASDTHIYILDTVAWKWSSSKDVVPASNIPLSPGGGASAPNNKDKMPLTIGVVCASLALIGAFVGYLVLRRRASRKAQKQTKGPNDTTSCLSDAEQYLSGDINLDDKPTYYNHYSGRDSGSSLGGWPSIAARKSIPQPSQGFAMRSMTPQSPQADYSVKSTEGQGGSHAEASKSQDPQQPTQSQHATSVSQRDTDKLSQDAGVIVGSIASDPYYPAHLAENDEEDADRWTFASSLSFDQREKAGGPLPTLRYIPSKTSGAAGLQRSMVQSSASLTPSFSASRAARRDNSAPSILSGRGSSIGPGSISLSAAGAGTPGQKRDGSISPRDTALFNSVSPLDRVSLMCSGLDIESRTSADEEGLSSGYLSPRKNYPQWRDSYQRESFVEEKVKEEEEEEEKHFTLQRSGSTSTGNSSTAYTTLDHPAMIMLIQNLPARYIVSKLPRPIHGRSNDIVFAVDSDTQQPIVIKSFARREAWERECRTLRRLRGPCVVELKHVATLVLSETDDPDKPAKIRLTILERLDETLAQMLKNARKARKLALREQAVSFTGVESEESLDLSGAGLYRLGPVLDQGYIKDIVKGVLRCLAWCHSKKIVYCDLKPTNIMRNRDDPRQQWKLIDLEASRVAEEECTSIGTARYCPPEVAAAIGPMTGSDVTANVTAQCSMDLWAFGCLFYELFATKPLIPATTSTSTVLHFLANPSPDTPALSNGLRWRTADELEIPHFEEAIQDKDARALIHILLHPDPRRRATMSQVLDSEFLNSGSQGQATSTE